ncbi:hypothetical protein [Agathobacter ruminis]|uniref:RES domain-containing protein n=1 Tax=Agathobacter ruminis TaxID=1712665 RepID=A0A2G3E6X5_9FIRM|nr:hypothetical protein [Agathobacter ruminis]MDC7301001.1 hypothetical protein [Agathobacter ruminis]PHU38951.1 hypothetical protein CSX02_00450 [Agathobacter ruminis]
MASAKDYINVAESLGQLSESTKKVIRQINFKGMTSALKIVAEQFKSVEGLQSNINSALKASQLQMNIQPVISEMMSQKYIAAQVFSNGEVAKQLANVQSAAVVMASLPNATQMLKDVQLGLANSNISACVNAIQKSLDSTSIAMADFSFVKTSELMKNIKPDIVMPAGLATAISELNKSSVERLAYNESIVYKSDERKFVSVPNENDYANAKELNIICRSEDLFELADSEEVFNENELMNFMTYLDEMPMLALQNEVGKKIYRLICHFPFQMGFDCNEYYHCRARAKDEAPYVWKQMKKAPYGVAGPGRYNHAGQAYFYFSDVKTGAETEICKHMSAKDKEDMVLQTVKVGVTKNAKLIDLSAKNMRGLNTLLRYIRFPLNDVGKNPRVYLIPSFISMCCKSAGIDGIKYYGGKDYSNYVTWDDGYYDFIGIV